MKDKMNLSSFIILLLFVNFIYANSYKNSNNNSNCNGTLIQSNTFKLNFKIENKINSSNINSRQNEKIQNLELDKFSGNIKIWSGWVKYFHYKSNIKFKNPKDFFVNSYFNKQKVLKKNLLKKDIIKDEKHLNETFINIPSKFHFFATLNNNFIEINGERTNKLITKIESLNLDMIDPINTIDLEKTGLTELGKFKEGYCLDLSVHKLKKFDMNFHPSPSNFDNSEGEHWIFCLEDSSEYDNFVSKLIILIDSRQNRIEQKENIESQPKPSEKYERYTGPDAQPLLDGFMILISDWSVCSRFCGGGKQFQQWQCIPPKKGGKECIGDNIRSRLCNINPCPNVTTKEDDSKQDEEVLEKPIIKSQAINNRPQENIDCVIRDEDVLHIYIKEKTKMKIPSRLVLNNKTISLFSNIEENKTIFTFDIKKVELLKLKNNESCFFIRSDNLEYQICGISNFVNFRTSWFKSFDLFKNKCYNDLNVDQETDSKSLNFGLNFSHNSNQPNQHDLSLIMDIEESSANTKLDLIKSKVEQQLELQSSEKLSKTQKDAFKVITREIDIEEMIKKEEMMKNQDKIKTKLDEYKHEKLKEKKLEEAIEKQEEIQNYKVKEITNNSNLGVLVNETREQIIEKRNKLKERINKIRKLAERRANIIDSKIKIIRNKMTKELIESTKKGNIELCKDGLDSEVKRKEYCRENIITDFQIHEECLDISMFGFVCCDHEFGKIMTSKKEECYNLYKNKSISNK